MNTPFYRPPSKEVPPFDKTHIPRHQIKRKVHLRKEKRLQIVEGDTVLVVDDDLIFLEIVSFMLTRLGISVLEAKDGVEAVEVFKQHPKSIRCVLCDLIIPRMNGWETLDALRRLTPGIPVILSSGRAQAEVFAGDHPELPQVFLGKPYSVAEKHSQRNLLHPSISKSCVNQNEISHGYDICHQYGGLRAGLFDRI